MGGGPFDPNLDVRGLSCLIMFTARNFFCFLICQRQGLVIFLFHNTEVPRVIST